MLSIPSIIGDRTDYLLEDRQRNPGLAIAQVLLALERLGADVVGIPCGTSHAPQILKVVTKSLANAGSSVRMVNMVREVAGHIQLHHQDIHVVGLLATKGTYVSGTYERELAEVGIRVLVPPTELQEKVQASIYDKSFGIKAHAHPVENQARNDLLGVAESLVAYSD